MTVTTTPGPTGHPGYSETLPRRPESAATARRLVRAACTAWGLESLAENGALIVSELVANAVQHARRESIRVLVERTAVRMIRVAVADFSRDTARGTRGGRRRGGRAGPASRGGAGRRLGHG